MAFYGAVRLLAAWCEVPNGFQIFRIELMSEFVVLEATFESMADQTAHDFFKQDGAKAQANMNRRELDQQYPRRPSPKPALGTEGRVNITVSWTARSVRRNV